MDDPLALEPAPGLPGAQAAQPPADRVLATTRDVEFSAYYRADFPRLVGFLVWQGIPLSAAAEIAQETMIEAFRQWHAIQHPSAWTRRVASRMWARRVAAVVETPTDDLPEVPSLLRVDEVAAWEQRQHILGLLAKLPPRQRQVLAWYLDGFEPAEIAIELGMTPEAVRGSLAKARRAIALRLNLKEQA